MSETGTVLVVGQHELDYPRNVLSQRLIRNAGYDVLVAHSRAPGPAREAALAAAVLRHLPSADAVFMTEGSHRFVPMVKALAKPFGRRVVFDPFTSRYDTYVEDRKRYAPGSLQAWRCRFMDWSAIRAADVCVFDTAEHRDYFAREYGWAGPSHVVEVGVDEDVFRALPPKPRGDTFEVLFYGTYIPLQGVEHIAAAAAELKDDPAIRFVLIGRGQTYPQVERAVLERGLDNVALRGPVTPAELVDAMAAADVCLGIFGDTRKAGSVVPNKVVQAAAVARPLITRRSPAVERYFHEDSATLVPPADPVALAAAIADLKADPGRADRLASQARAVFERTFSERALTAKMGAALEAALDP